MVGLSREEFKALASDLSINPGEHNAIINAQSLKQRLLTEHVGSPQQRVKVGIPTLSPRPQLQQPRGAPSPFSRAHISAPSSAASPSPSPHLLKVDVPESQSLEELEELKKRKRALLLNRSASLHSTASSLSSELQNQIVTQLSSK